MFSLVLSRCSRAPTLNQLTQAYQETKTYAVPLYVGWALPTTTT
jgi:hypothetical protein